MSLVLIYITFLFFDWDMLLLYSSCFCFLKVTYKYYMSLFRVANVELLNLDKIIQNLHRYMGHSVK